MGTSRNSLMSMSWDEFEVFVADVWGKLGWDTTLTPDGPDGATDVVAVRHEPYTYRTKIQVKRYELPNKVGVREVREYSSLLHSSDVDSVIIVTTSEFTSTAIEEAERLNVKLIDGGALDKIVSELPIMEGIEKYEPHTLVSSSFEEHKGSGLMDVCVPEEAIEFYGSDGRNIGYRFSNGYHLLGHLDGPRHGAAREFIKAHELFVVSADEVSFTAVSKSMLEADDWDARYESKICSAALETVYEQEPKVVSQTRVEPRTNSISFV